MLITWRISMYTTYTYMTTIQIKLIYTHVLHFSHEISMRNSHLKAQDNLFYKAQHLFPHRKRLPRVHSNSKLMIRSSLIKCENLVRSLFSLFCCNTAYDGLILTKHRCQKARSSQSRVKISGRIRKNENN